TFEVFSSLFSAFFSMDGGGSFMPIAVPANVTVMVRFNSQIGNTRIFDTEILQLDMADGLPMGVLIRQSPSQRSLGRTTITLAPATGLYDIHSEFDVYSDLSFDGGQTFMTSSVAGHVEVMECQDGPGSSPSNPEPSSWVLLGLGALGLIGYSW